MTAGNAGAAPPAGRYQLSVVVPAFQEAERIGATLRAVVAYLREKRLSAEVVVVDDGSTDDTAAIASRELQGFPGRVVRLADNRGKGHAVRTGVRAAAGRWILVSDADLSTPIAEHEKLARAAREYDVDLVIGSRAAADADVQVHQAWYREAMGKTFNALVRLATGLPYGDTQCGFKLFDRERLLPVVELLAVDGFAWDVELLFVCERLGLSIREVGVAWRNDPSSRVGLLTDPVRMLIDLARIRWRFRRGAYRPRRQAT